MQLPLKIFRTAWADLFWEPRAIDGNDVLDIKLKKPLPAYAKFLSIPASINISYSQKGHIATVMVDLNEEIQCGRVMLQTFMIDGRIVPCDTPGARWTTVNRFGEAPLDGIYAWTFLPEASGEYHFRAKYDADGPDCPFDSIGWTEAESVLLH